MNNEDVTELLQDVKKEVFDFLEGDSAEAGRWYHEAELRGKEVRDSDRNGQNLVLEHYVVSELVAMLFVARSQKNQI